MPDTHSLSVCVSRFSFGKDPMNSSTLQTDGLNARGLSPHRRSANAKTVDRLLASARAMPGHVAGIPAGIFWPALLMTIIDTRGSTLCGLLRLSASDFDRDAGELRIRGRIQVPHPRSTDALIALQSAGAPYALSQLFPWPFDTLPHLKTLRNHFTFLRRRVMLPSHITFRWLRNTAKTDPHLMSRIDPFAQFEFDPNVRTIGQEHGMGTLKKQRNRAVEGLHPLSVPPEISLVRFFEDVYAPLRLTKTRCDRMRSTLQKVMAFTATEPHFALLNDNFCDTFTVWMLNNSILQRTTINLHLRNFLALWRLAWKKRRVDELPRDVTFLRVPKRTPDCWSIDELHRLIATAAQEPGLVGVVPARVFWPTLLAFLFVTGLRIGAALSLPRKSLDLENGWLHVPAECQKQLADQSIQIGPDCLAAMQRLLEFDTGPLLFHSPFRGPQVYRKYLRRILERAELPTGRRDLFHKLRRTCGTFIAKALGEQAAQQYLGHSSVQVTRAYIDPRKLDRAQAVAVLPRIVASGN